MHLYLDAHLSPEIAPWLAGTFGIECESLIDLGRHTDRDERLFAWMRERSNSVILTKDGDFVSMVLRNGPPPRVILLTCGNTSNAALRVLLLRTLGSAIGLLKNGEALVEIG